MRTSFDPASLESLRKKFSGDIILPADASYGQARKAYIFTGSPAVVLKPRTTADAAAALRYSRENSQILSIRSGGHSGAGLSTNDGGIIIDLSFFNTVEILDKEERRVRIGSGATWGEAAAELQRHGLAVSSGDTKTVGVGGLTLGAGIGWMVRKHGLSIDNLTAADIVLADGSIIHASAGEHPELFWAIRGGGGNFGIVTHFEFSASSVGNVFAGMIIYQPENLPRLLTGWRDHMRTASEDLTTMLVIMPPFAGNPAMAISMCCFAGDDETSAKHSIDPLLKIGTVVQNTIVKKPYAEALEEAHPPEGVKVIVKNGFVKDFSSGLIDIIASTAGKEGSPIFQIRSLGGAMNLVNRNETAFAHRSSEILIVYAAFLSMAAAEQEVNNSLAPWRMITPFTSGSYINFFHTATKEEVASSYPQETYDRLAKIKKQYDPDNIFNRNYNIPPAV